MKVKPWQIWVIVLGLLVGGASILYSSLTGTELKLEHRYHLIDVESGEIYLVDTTKYRPVIPALKPGTDRRTLLPVEKEDGRWFVLGRWLADAKEMASDVEFKAVDRQTGELTVTPKSPVKYPPVKWE